MPYIEKNPKKMFYKIGEVADVFGVKPSLIRFWEKEFDVLKPFKNDKGIRYFTEEDMEVFQTIFHLVKEKGHTLESAKKILATRRSAADKQREIYDSLCRIKDFILEIKSEL